MSLLISGRQVAFVRLFYSMRVWLCVLFCVFDGASFTCRANPYVFKNYDVDNGLAHKTAYCFLHDSEGFLWIGTTNGLSRFDGYSFKNFYNDENDSLSLGANIVTSLAEDTRGLIWMTTSSGIRYYDKRHEVFRSIHVDDAQKKLVAQSICVDVDGVVWAAHPNLGILKISSQNGVFVAERFNSKCKVFDKLNVYVWRVLALNNYLWAGTSHGLVQINLHNGQSKLYPLGKEGDVYFASLRSGGANELLAALPHIGVLSFNTQSSSYHIIDKNDLQSSGTYDVQYISDAVRTSDSALWIASSPGLSCFVHNELLSFNANPLSNTYFKGDSPFSLFIDKSNALWVGTLNSGVFSLLPQTRSFQSAFRLSNYDASVAAAATMCSFSNGVFLFANSKGVFRYTSRFDVLSKLPDRVFDGRVLSLVKQDENHCFMLTNNAVLQYDIVNGSFTHIFSTEMASCMYFDGATIWLGYWGNGVVGYNLQSHKYYRISVNTKDQTKNIVYTITGDSDGSLWLGTYGTGLVHVSNPQSIKPSIECFEHHKNKNSISCNEVLCLYNQALGIWIGTCGGGVNYFDKQSKTFVTYNTKNGLLNNVVESIVADQFGNVWFVSNALTSFNVRNKTLTHYTQADGLIGGYITNSYAHSRDGWLYIGGSNGITVFNPQQIQQRLRPPRPMLTALYIKGSGAVLRDTADSDNLIACSISYLDTLHLSYASNAIAIEFASLLFNQSQNFSYQYKLQGVDKNWTLALKNSRIASYASLPPGHYTFMVRASSGAMVWSDVRFLHIIITPPWWKSILFRVLLIVVCIVLSFLFVFRRIYTVSRLNRKLEAKVEQRTHALSAANTQLEDQNQKLTNNQLVIEEKNAQLREALATKDTLIALLAHDFKNPLTTLHGYASLLASLSDMQLETVKMYSKHIITSADSLLHQMVMVLDWAQAQSVEMQMETAGIDIEPLLRDVIVLLQESAFRKNITINLQFDCKYFAVVDPRMISTVFRNLLANAIKFTPRGGTILVAVQDIDSEIEVAFIDTGRGIGAERCYEILHSDKPLQSERGTESEKGLGLGLQIVKAFLQKHNSELLIKSTEGQGAAFSFSLAKGAQSIVRQQRNPIVSLSKKNVSQNLQRTETVLFIDDDLSVIQLFKQSCGNDFHVIEALDGQAGLLFAQNMLPHLIVCDINMPKMSGIELCALLKSNKSTAHIPIIIITAQSDVGIQADCYSFGADDFVEKPFNVHLLKQKMQAILELRKRYDEYLQYGKADNSVLYPSYDNKVVNQVIDAIHVRYSDSEFDTDSIADQAHLSRSQLWRVFKATTGQTASEYLRDVRMKKAVELLNTGQYRISEVAYQVGFSDPKYFTKCFMKDFGITPSCYLEERGRSL